MTSGTPRDAPADGYTQRDIWPKTAGKGLAADAAPRNGQVSCWRYGLRAQAAVAPGSPAGLTLDGNLGDLAFTFDCEDVTRLPYQPGTFDAVISSMVVPYLTQPAQALASWHSLLRPHGHLAEELLPGAMTPTTIIETHTTRYTSPGHWWRSA